MVISTGLDLRNAYLATIGHASDGMVDVSHISMQKSLRTETAPTDVDIEGELQSGRVLGMRELVLGQGMLSMW